MNLTHVPRRLPTCRHNVEACRILITVPACLESLLMSPASQEWVQRVRYVILDEASAPVVLCK